ncbi:MAG TPA: outer membrane lipoprotein-sorting protein [Blastocatellia bacterium]|nr:outer membrane lipoprotein-sorting protein [Blastocatellia bacterium]
MIRRAVPAILSLAFLFCIQAPAQTVDEIIKKSIDAQGGADKLKALKSVKITGKVIQQGIEIPLTIQQKRPNMVRVDATFQGKTQTAAYDGQSGWKTSPFQGSPDPEKIAGDELKELEEQSDMDGPLMDYKAKGHSVELIGKEDLEGTPVYKLKLTLKNGDVRNIYIDAENSLALKVSLKRKTPGGEIEADQYVGNYKPVNGMMFAFSVETKVGGQTQSQIVFDKVEIDVPIDDSVFKMPAKPAEKPKTEEKKPPAR